MLTLCVTYHLDVSMYVWFPVFAYLGTFMCVFCCSTLHLVVSRCTCNVCDFQGNSLISSVPPLRFSPPITACPDFGFRFLWTPPKDALALLRTLIVHGPFTIHTRHLRRIKVQGSFLMMYAAVSEFPYCIPSAFST